MSDIGPPPNKSTARHVTETIVEAGLSAVPVVGGPAAVVWVERAGAVYRKRLHDWLTSLAEAVQDLIDRVDGLSAESLAENDDFLDAVANATSAAQATGQKEKLDALRNAVLNAAIPGDLDSDTQAIFMRHVRDLTPSHLRLLKLLSDPPKWFREHDISWPENISGGLANTVVEPGIPEFRGRRDLYDQLDRDLAAAGMTKGGGLHSMMSERGLAAGRASETGKAFLAFITDPRERLVTE